MNTLTAQIAAAYWGAEYQVTYTDGCIARHTVSEDTISGIGISGATRQLVLTRLSNITDEDAMEVAKISTYRSEIIGAMEKFGKHAVLHHTIQPQTLDFLRSKSYDCGYGNIPSLIDNGIAVEKI